MNTPAPKAKLQTLFFENSHQWEEWLANHYELQAGVLLKFAKKSSGIISLDYKGALDVALCYGWIDGQTRSFDDTYYLQKFTPRRPKSTWSKVNIEKVTALINNGKMQPPGQAAIDAAQADGRWAAAYEPQSKATMPDDFAAALAHNPAAQQFFDSLTKANKYAFFWRLMTAKTPQKRQEKLQKFVEMLAAGKAFH